MKKWLWAFIIIITVFALLYASAWFIIIPNAAEASLPYKWKNVVEGLKRKDYEIYLGKPSAKRNSDMWIQRNGNYTFSMEIFYNIDSAATSVQVKYTFSNYFFYKEGIVRKNHE